MKILKRLGISLVVLGMGGCGLGADILGIEDGILDAPHIVRCTSFSDCEVGTNECRTPLDCVKGKCEFQLLPPDTPLISQVEGDCTELRCNNQGLIQSTALSTDITDDGNPCTLDECDGRSAVHKPVPGLQLACYSGPLGTAGVGACKTGVQLCGVEGNLIGVCDGEILPEAETCDALEVDEDCDGLINEEGAECVCGDGFRSNDEECDDGNQDSADACTVQCMLPVCGDGILQVGAGEECDDGGTSDADICSSLCKEQKVLAIDGGGEFTCALLNGGVVKCWGYNNGGQLGLEHTENRGDGLSALGQDEMGKNLPAVNLGTNKTAVAIDCGEYHACALLNDAQIKCWGYNVYGELGRGIPGYVGKSQGSMGDSLLSVDLGTGKTAVAVSAGGRHTCALLNDGAVKCWGRNFYGQLGQEDTVDRGLQADQMGNNLLPIKLGINRTAIAISAGDNHSCAVLDDGSVKCWGYSAYGAIGFNPELPPHSNYGGMAGDMGDNLPPVDLGAGKIAIGVVAGSQFSCALLSDQTVKCWGVNSSGQLAQEDTKNRGEQQADMGDFLPAVNLGTNRTAKAIRASGGHVCVLLDDNSAKCWGFNIFGQLGQDHAKNLGDNLGEMGDNLNPINLGLNRTGVAIAAGYSHACAVLDDGSAKCWGHNSRGELGLGTVDARGDQVGEMAALLPIKLFSAFW